MRVAVLGSGRLARLRASALLGDPRVDWVGVGDLRADWAADAAEEVGAHSSGLVDDVLAQAPDAAIVSSATRDHAAQVAACIELGLPIFCEKPLALDLEQSEQAVGAAQAAGVTLQVGFQRRHDQGFLAAHDLVASGGIGTLYSISLLSHDHQPPDERFAATSGGMFRDLHIHDFDLARWLSGLEVEEVFTVASTRLGLSFLRELGDVDITGILLRMQGDLPVLISGARHDPTGHDVRCEVFGSLDSLVVGLDARTPLTPVGDSNCIASANPYSSFLDRFRDAYFAETAAFVGLAAGERDNPCPGTEAVAAIRIAAAAEISHREKRPVSPAEVKSCTT